MDQDGAFADTADAVAGRRASVVEVGGTLVVSAHGGDPVQAAQLQAVFDMFADAEYRKDVERRREAHRDDAALHPLPRTHTQRSFDALAAIFATAYATAVDIGTAVAPGDAPSGPRLPEQVVNLVCDDRTASETLAHAGIVLPNGNTIELGDSGWPASSSTTPKRSWPVAARPRTGPRSTRRSSCGRCSPGTCVGSCSTRVGS